jgi:hypothetical protein
MRRCRARGKCRGKEEGKAWRIVIDESDDRRN